MDILESIFSNLESNKLNKIIRSNLYWPILFLALYVFPKYFPSHWIEFNETRLWVAFGGAMLLTLAYPYAWKTTIKNKEKELAIERENNEKEYQEKKLLLEKECNEKVNRITSKLDEATNQIQSMESKISSMHVFALHFHTWLKEQRPWVEAYDDAWKDYMNIYSKK